LIMRPRKKGPLLKPRDPNFPLLLKLRGKTVPDKKKKESKRKARRRIAKSDVEDGGV